MRLDRDEFIITFDPAKIDEPGIIADIEKAGYRSYVVKNKAIEKESQPLSKTGVDPVFDEALARAKKEQKLIVIDFTASWCVPCKKMLKITFPDPKVALLLGRCIFLEIDTDEHPALAKRFGVVGLPDIRFLTSDGKEIKRLLNYQSPDAFARHLSEILKQNH